MGLCLSYGLAYNDFLCMTMDEVEAFTGRVIEIRELNNYDLAVKVGQLFSEDGLKPPRFIESQIREEKVRDSSELSEEERQYYINQIMKHRRQQSEKIQEVVRG